MRPGKGGMNARSGLAVSLLVMALALGGCASTSPTVPPSDSVTFLTNDYRFKSVMESGDDVKGWARDTLHIINELQYQLDTERNK